MADGAEIPRDDDADHREEPVQPDEGSAAGEEPRAVFRMELRDELPGDAAIVGVETEGVFTWVGSRKHMDDQARDELVDQLTTIVERGWWTQNWRGPRT